MGRSGSKGRKEFNRAIDAKRAATRCDKRDIKDVLRVLVPPQLMTREGSRTMTDKEAS